MVRLFEYYILLIYIFIECFFFYLKSLDQNKDVVYIDSQYQERYDFNDDESGGYFIVVEEIQG